MNTLRCLVLILCASLGALFALSACTSPEQRTAAQDLADTVTEATRDGVVTEDEAKLIAAKMQVYIDAPSTDWAGLATTAIATLVAAFTGLRYLPNSQIIGKEEAKAVDKVAGISTG